MGGGGGGEVYTLYPCPNLLLESFSLLVIIKTFYCVPSNRRFDQPVYIIMYLFSD